MTPQEKSQQTTRAMLIAAMISAMKHIEIDEIEAVMIGLRVRMEGLGEKKCPCCGKSTD